jgi:hypothetical protein
MQVHLQLRGLTFAKHLWLQYLLHHPLYQGPRLQAAVARTLQLKTHMVVKQETGITTIAVGGMADKYLTDKIL